MAIPVTSISQEPVTPVILDAMTIVAADRLRQHEKIVRLRALREAAEAAQAPRQRNKKVRAVRS